MAPLATPPPPRRAPRTARSRAEAGGAARGLAAGGTGLTKGAIHRRMEPTAEATTETLLSMELVSFKPWCQRAQHANLQITARGTPAARAGSLAVYAWACPFRRAACPPPGPEVCCPTTHACPLDPILPTPDGSDGSEPCARHKPDGSWDYSNCGSGGSGGAGDGSGDDSTGEAGMGRASTCSTPNLRAAIVECLPTRLAHSLTCVPLSIGQHIACCFTLGVSC